MKKTVFALLLFVMAGFGLSMAQSQLQPVEGPIQPGQGQYNQAETFQAVVTVIGNEVCVVSLQGETFGLRNGFGLMQGNQIQPGDLIWVTQTQAQDFNSSRSNKER